MSSSLFRALVLGFFIYNAYETILNPVPHASVFISSYAKYEKTLQSYLGLNLPPSLQTASIETNSLTIVLGFAAMQGLLAIVGLFAPSLGALAGCLYFLKTCFRSGFILFLLSYKESQDWTPLFASLSLTIGAMMVGCSKKEGKVQQKLKFPKTSYGTNV